ncbi:MAG TPA: PAS domain S-box protein [Nitrospiraceae bacterium]|nr:PAS domain S-box protein [Nitrospiraceae bacterium]
MRILLIEDNPVDIRLLQEYLPREGGTTGGFQITHAEHLAEGIERLAEGGFDAVLLGLSLPDSQGMKTLVQMRAAAKGVPIVVLTSIEDETLGVQLIQAGAQDFLVKGQVTGSLLRRSLRYAVERKRTDVALRDSEARFRSLVEGVRDVIFTLSKDGVITSLNAAFETITQWPRDKWIGQAFATLLHPEDLPLAINLFECILGDREAPTCVLRVRSRESGYVVGEFVGVPHIQNGQIVGVLGIARDVTERKRAEDTLERLRHLYGLLLTSTHDGIYGIDREGHAIFVNPAAARMIGCSSEELVGRHMHTIVHHTRPDGTMYPSEECSIYRAFREGAVQYVADDVFWRKDGKSFPVEYTSTPIIERGEIVGAVVTFRDITQRKRAERELRESEARLRAILDNSPNLVFLKDMQGRYLHVNRQFEQAFHISHEAIVGKTDTEIFPADQAAEFRANDRKVLQAGIPFEFEEVALQDDGPHTSIVHKFPLYDGDGKPYALCGITTDITQRKVMEKAVQQAEAKYRDIFDNAVEGIFQSTPDGRYLSANPALARMYGYESPEELMASVVDIGHQIYVDPECRRELIRLVESRGVVRGYEYQVHRKDGTTIWISESARAVRDESGRILYYEGTIEDVTERKLAEDELRKSLEYLELAQAGAEAGLWDWEIRSNQITWSKQYYRLYGLSPATMPSYENWLASVYGEDRQRADLAVREALKQRSDLNLDYRIIHPERGLRWLLAIGRTICDDEGAAVRMTGFSFDITESKRAEEELQRTLGQVRTLSRRLEVVREDERTRIARELHDELGMRMTCLKLDLTRLQSIMNDTSRHKVEEKIRSMIEQVDTAIAAIQGLVAELRPGVLDDLGLVAAIEWQCRDFERRTGIRCIVDSGEEDIPLDSARATAAFRICQEALTNVLRHARAKEIRVHLERLDKQLMMDVHDDGQGILPEKNSEMTSLGLLGMRERAAAVGGTLWIVGSPGQGTTVTLRMPLA